MSGKVTYDSKYLKPTPFPNISTQIDRAGNGDVNDVVYNITLDGYILAHKGSPTTSGTFFNASDTFCENVPSSGWTDAIMDKYCAIHNLFGCDYRELCIGNDGLGGQLTAYPRLVDFSLDTSDQNPVYAKYQATFEADNIYCDGVGLKPSGIDCIKTFDDEWGFEYDRTAGTHWEGDNRVFQVSRNISVEGRPKIVNGVKTKTAAQCAKEFACSVMTHGSPSIPPTGCVLPDQYMSASQKKYNYVDVHTINERAGTYSVTESWIFTSGNYIDNYTVNFNDTDQDGCSTVDIEGTITGYECRVNGEVTDAAIDAATDRYQRLLAASGFKTRAEDFTGITVDSQPESSTAGYNPFAGTVDYNYTFKQRPVRYVENARYENIDIQNNFDEDIVTKTFLLGKGEYVSSINGSGFGKAPSTTLSINLVYDCGVVSHPWGPRYDTTEAAAIQTIVDTYHPSGIVVSGSGVFENIRVESQDDQWERSTGSYTYNVNWTYNLSQICVN